MSGNLKIHLKPNERIYINGAVVRVDRKVALELLNDVVFLLEGHVIQEEQATTPLRQLYFVVQSMLIDPKTRGLADKFTSRATRLIAAFKNQDVLEGLVEVKQLIERERTYEALKRIRSLFPIEAEILGIQQLVEKGKAVA